MQSLNSNNDAYSTLGNSRDRREIDRTYDSAASPVLTRSSIFTSAMSLLSNSVGSLFTSASGHDGLVDIVQIQPIERQGHNVSRFVVIQDGDWALGKHSMDNEISTEPGDGFLEAFKTLIHDHHDWFLEIFKRHRSIRRNAGGRLASGADEAERYDFVMEGTTPDPAWKGWLGTKSERGYDPGSENTFAVNSGTVEPIVRKPSKRFACIFSYGPIEDRVHCVVVFEPVEKLKVEQPDGHYIEDEKYLVSS
jgi:hypothetical protein